MLKQPLLYVTDNKGRPVAEQDAHLWAQWFDCIGNRILRHDELSPGVLVSTVFLGVDHNHSGRGPPVLCEAEWVILFQIRRGGIFGMYRLEWTLIPPPAPSPRDLEHFARQLFHGYKPPLNGSL